MAKYVHNNICVFEIITNSKILITMDNQQMIERSRTEEKQIKWGRKYEETEKFYFFF